MYYFYLILLVVILALVGTLTEGFHTTPDFNYPTYIPQPQGNGGWGYRDNAATLRTLKYQERGCGC